VLIHAFSGKVKTISPLLWVVGAGFLIFFARGPIEALFGVGI
jgi:AGZA family xanthine/uracil permease-like MFS transporter